MKYLAAMDPQQRIPEPVEVEEPIRPIESSRRSNQAVGIAVAAAVAIVGLGWGGQAWAPPAQTDRGADSAAEVVPSLRAGGADLAARTTPSTQAQGAFDASTPATSAASGDATLVAPGLRVTWSAAETIDGSLISVVGSVDPGVERVVVRVEHGSHPLASATVPAGLEDERTGTDGRPRGRSRFAVSFVIRAGLPATGLRLAVGWSGDGSTGTGTIGWPVRVVPANAEHLRLRTTPGRHRR